MLFFKALKAGGVSGADPSFVYPLQPGGEVVHPKPDRAGKKACGRGIHVAKTVEAACVYVPGLAEIWVVEPGDILGEDDQKVRTDRLRMIRRLAAAELIALVNEQPAQRLWWLYYYGRDVRGTDRASLTSAASAIAARDPSLKWFENLMCHEFRIARAA